ncbi:glycine cleavage system aminomethyltransferase GcvT [Rothia sp. AR01]|uniref:Aminomethyltransferase n=1 Tax=Rothia santali TaxID=2949643 RepID=A0A9X2HH59_9MICC|nr:glycine cleavage system aminomethyltransferase GcvT [Rothia santali]MCP3424773.1 glycine cleavage system aminomethyltransferase GcvT [Rothia santali]
MSAETTETAAARRTSLHGVHEELAAVFTDFGGWDMPLKYGNDVAEHRAVRSAAGLFDLSHMGEIRVTGPEASALLDHALVSSFGGLAVGRAKYSVMADARGGIVDDLITYRLGEREFLVVPNAANAGAVLRELTVRGGGFEASVRDESGTTALIALQGPVAAAVLGRVLEELHLADGGSELSGLRYYAAAPARVAGHEVLLARTGYTGEDGFELYLPAGEAEGLWRALAEAGEADGVVPAGLAARDSLRLEAGMPLYGHELGPDVSPCEAGLERMVGAALKAKGAFVGREALAAALEAAGDPGARTLVGLRGLGKRPARAGAVLLEPADTDPSGERGGRRAVGVVTSGIPSPTLGHPVAMALVERRFAEPGLVLPVEIRGRAAEFEVVPLPFYRPGR